MNPSGLSNALLASLDVSDWSKWEPYFERIELKHRQELLRPDDRLEYLWFPEGGVQSQVIESLEGGSVEVAIVGSEGVVGLPGIFGVRHMATRTIAQLETTAMRIRLDDFSKHLQRDHPLLRRLESYAAATLGSLSQIAGCNRLHSPEQRLCRWLLMVRNRVHADTLPMTHEFLSLMLGTRRASVTEVAQTLQKRRLINYERGSLEFLDVSGLEQCACECYEIINGIYSNAGIL